MICRLCLCCEDNMNSVLDPRLQLCDKIQRIVSVKVLLNDELPVTVCNKCTEKVDAFYAFQQQIEKNYETLKQWAEDGKCKKHKRSPIVTTTIPNIGKDESESKNINCNMVVFNENFGQMQEKNIYLQDNLGKLDTCTDLDEQVESAPRIIQLVSSQLPDISRKVSVVRYICLICFKHVHPDDLNYHANIHFKEKGSIQNEAPFNCELCSETYDNRVKFVTHQRTHFKVKPFMCKNCKRKFGSLDLLECHMIRCECENKHLLPCEYCGSLFKHRHEIIDHRKTHSEIQSLTCQLCLKRLSTKRSFHAHMKYHQNGRQFMCDICPKAYFTWSQLKLHLQIHTSTKSFLCCVCGKYYGSAVELKRHKTYHYRTKIFKCSFCESVFYENWKRNEHVKEKHEKRIYICETCGKLLYSKCGLQKHTKNYHSLDTQEIEQNTNNALDCDNMDVISSSISESSNINIQEFNPTVLPELIEENGQVHNERFILITEQDSASEIADEALARNNVALYILTGNSV